MSAKLPTTKKRRVTKVAWACPIYFLNLLVCGMIRREIQTAVGDLASIVQFYLQHLSMQYFLHNHQFVSIMHKSNNVLMCEWQLWKDDLWRESIIFKPELSTLVNQQFAKFPAPNKFSHCMEITIDQRYLTGHKGKHDFLIKFGVIKTPKCAQINDCFQNDDVFNTNFDSFYWYYHDLSCTEETGHEYIVKRQLGTNDYESHGLLIEPTMEFQRENWYQVRVNCIKYMSGTVEYYLKFEGCNLNVYNGRFPLDFNQYDYWYAICVGRLRKGQDRVTVPYVPNFKCQIEFETL